MSYVFVMLVYLVWGLLLAFPIMWTWNYVMPHILLLPAITWGEAWCLYFLTINLFRPINSQISLKKRPDPKGTK